MLPRTRREEHLEARPVNEIPSRIRHAPAFRRLDPDDLLDLVRASEVRVFSPGETLAREGAAPTQVFLLLSGQVSIRRGDTTGRDYVLALRESGDWIGEIGIVRGSTHSATAVAETPTRALAVPRQRFVRAVLTSPEAAADLLEALADRQVESDYARLKRIEMDEETDRKRNGPSTLPAEFWNEPGGRQSFHEATRIFQARLIQQTLEDVDGNVSEAARRLGIARSYVYKLLSALQVPRRPRTGIGEPSPIAPLDLRSRQ
jgi:CRP-like cAMP-binding protein